VPAEQIAPLDAAVTLFLRVVRQSANADEARRLFAGRAAAKPLCRSLRDR
jgi:hypothetical protein